MPTASTPTSAARPRRRLSPALAAAALAAMATVAALAAQAASLDAATRARVRDHLKLSPEAAAAVRGEAPGSENKHKAILGARIFKDASLSQPAGQSCSSCHHSVHAFSERDDTSTGANPLLHGFRNAPSITYAKFTPPLQSGGDEGPLSYFGGLFRDGRADFLQDQARGPFLNPIEMGNPDVASVVAKAAAASWAPDLQRLYGADIFSRPEDAFNAMADALAIFERGPDFARFDSKYDAYLAGTATLTPAEARGLAIFNDPARGNCALCHVSGPTKVWGKRPLFSDFGYDNIGTPRNPDNAYYAMPASFNPDGAAFIDIGLRSQVMRDATIGQFKAPSLRNVAVSGPYMHNGYFKTLRGVVDFYNTRDVKPACANPMTREADAIAQGCWPAAEWPATVNTTNMGNLHLSSRDVDDLVAFMKTLTDGYVAPTAPKKTAKR